MKKIFTLIIAFMAIAFPMTALATDGNATQEPIILSSHPKDNQPNPLIHRAPMRIPAEAWYDATAQTISIIYYGEVEGEAYFYKDGQLIESSSEINTNFLTEGPGFYTVEIITDSWSASGSIEI